MLTVVASGKAAPGVTTSTWALAVAWPRPVLVADCDPAGGDMAAGLVAGRVSTDRGVLSWSTAARHGVSATAAAGMLPAHAAELPERPDVWFVPGFANATQAHSFTEDTWDRLGRALQCCSAAIGRDALVDAGRLAGQQWAVTVPVLRASDQVLLAVRPTLRSVHAAQDTVTRLRYELGDLARVSALVVGDGPYRAAEVATALEIRLAAQLPADRAAAGALSDGTVMPMKLLLRSPLLRAATGLTQKLIAAGEKAEGDNVAVSR